MGILLSRGINAVNVIFIIVAIVTDIRYFMEISQYMDKRKYATKRINAVIADRKKSGLIYYVYTFAGLDEYAGVTFYDKSLKLMEQYKKDSTVSLYVNPENLGQFWVEKANESDKRKILWTGIAIMLGLMVIESVFKVPAYRFSQTGVLGDGRLHSDNRRSWEHWGVMTVCVGIAIIGCVWAARLAFKYENIKKHITKRINVVITGKVQLRYSYFYSFLGQDEYEGVAFCHKWLEVPTEHEIGETVPLLINEYNLEEFWFEEAKADYGKYAIVFGALAVFIFLFFIAWANL